MAAITQTIPNFLGGVSNQPDVKKQPGQVRGATNAYPDPTFGLIKRPGLKFMTELSDGLPIGGTAYDNTDLDNGKWFYYNRDDSEKYIGCIVGKSTSAYGEIHVWNAAKADGVTATTKELSGGSGYSTGSEVATTSAGAGTGLTVAVAQSGGTVNGVTIVDGGSGYAVDEVITVTGGGGNATFKVATISDDVYKKCTVSYGTGAREYLGKKESADLKASVNSEDYDVVTIRDTSIIVNKNRVVTAVAASAHTAKKIATVTLSLVEYSSEYKVIIKIGGTTYTSTHDTYASDNRNPTDTDTNLNASTILTALKTKIDNGGDAAGGAVSNLSCTIIGNTLELEYNAAMDVSASGGVSGKSLTAYQNVVDNIAWLPSETVHNRVVKIRNTGNTFDVYYVKFNADDGTSGSGVWEETIGPGEDTGLTISTMPHHLYSTDLNKFTFSRIDGNDAGGSAGTAGSIAAHKWVDRLVGDSTTNEHPSFKGKTIQQAFYYNNRLGFLTEDNVSMSRSDGKSDSFFNFYMVTAQTASEADPIDISCSSIRPAVLHSIIPTAQGLLLFSQNQQFIMFSTEGNLTPTTALIRGLSNYKMETNISPVDIGTTVSFVSKTHTTAGYTRVFGMLPQGSGEAPKVVDIGRIVSEYIPATITALHASPQNSFIAMYGTGDSKIYFYRTYSDGQKEIMQTWFDWDLPGNVHTVQVDSDTMYTVVKTGTGGTARYNLCSATLTQTPEEEIIVTADGQQVNPHMDFYKVTSAVSQYPVESVTITNEGSSYSGTPTVAIAAPASGTQATGTAVVTANKVTGITITNPGKGYDPANPPAVTFSGGGGSNAAGTAVIYDGSYCQLPFTNLTSTLDPVVIISGNATDNFSGTTQSGLSITPTAVTFNSIDYFKVSRKDLSAEAAKVFLGYKYNYDITLPNIYVRRDPEGRKSDYTAALTVARMKFSIGLSSVVGFKLKRKGVQALTQTFTGDGSTTIFSPDFDVKDKTDVIVKKDGAKQILGTDYTIADHATLTDKVSVTFTSAPKAARTNTTGTAGSADANVTLSAESVEIYIDEWYTLHPTQNANYYLADDVPLEGSGSQSLFILPIHQRSDNYTLRVFSDSPFPVALTSATWEGNYSPRYYRRL